MLEERISQLVTFEPARYTILNGGKRIRPRIVLDIAQNDVAALDPACALEMIHTYSLIHDDLPCMDNDDFRRKKPSLHKVYGEATAILAGDYLLTRAFEVVAETPHLTPTQKLELSKILSNRGCAMVRGQHLDITDPTHEDVRPLKTGALFQAAFEFGAIIKGEPLAPYTDAGARYGLAYQLLDDIEDGDLDATPSIQKKIKDLLDCDLLSIIL